MGYAAATGQGTWRTDETRARDLAALAQQGWGACFFYECGVSAVRSWRFGETGERGKPLRPRLKKHGAVCADRLAKKRTARASGVFMGAVNPAPLKRESPLRQSASRRQPAADLWRLQILAFKEVGATLLSSKVK